MMKVLCFGDSHVKRMSAVPVAREIGFSFLGIAGLKAAHWERHCNNLKNFDVIVIQLGGNDVTAHPDKPNITETIRDTEKNIQSLMQFCRSSGKIGLVTSPIMRPAGETATSLLNSRLRKRFRSFFIKVSLDAHLSDDGVHLNQRGYTEFLHAAREAVNEKSQQLSTV